MTNTDTMDVDATVAQIQAIQDAVPTLCVYLYPLWMLLTFKSIKRASKYSACGRYSL
ncbi:hypothetical protein ACOBV8_22065 (plasmid) [Pseudoalteromonas espejiana]